MCCPCVTYRTACLALLLAACSGGSSSAPRPTTTATPTTVAPQTTTTALLDVGAISAPEDLAALITTAERGVRDPSTPADQLVRLAETQQAAYRRLAAIPDWRPSVLGATPPDLRPIVDANATAAAELRALTPPRDTLPDWQLRPPLPADALLGYYREAETASGVPWPFLAAIHLVETRMGRIRSASTAGAQGPMQFIPSTWATYGRGDINDDRDAILAAGRYLRVSGAPADMATALYRYNNSNRYVTAISAYAGVLAADERAYLGYYHWPVVVRLTTGDAVLR